MNLRKGFTLIELLVVIAIIGLLSSVVLASLSTARSRAAAGRIQSQMSSMRAQAELYTGAAATVANVACVTTAANLFGTANNGLGTLINAVVRDTPGAALADTRCASSNVTPANGGSWAVAAILPANQGFWCADSTGFSGRSGAGALATVITTANACN